MDTNTTLCHYTGHSPFGRGQYESPCGYCAPHTASSVFLIIVSLQPESLGNRLWNIKVTVSMDAGWGGGAVSPPPGGLCPVDGAGGGHCMLSWCINVTRLTRPCWSAVRARHKQPTGPTGDGHRRGVRGCVSYCIVIGIIRTALGYCIQTSLQALAL